MSNYYGSCGWGGGYGGQGYDGDGGVRGILRTISLNTRISVHFDSTSVDGRFLGIERGTVVILADNGRVFYIPIRKVLAVDLIP